MKIDGACHCGFIAYEAEVDPEKVIVCHCRDCQIFSGSAFRTTVMVPEAEFTLISGAPKIYVKTAQSGNKRAQAFCPDCGTAIYATSVGDGPKILGLRVATSRQAHALPPKRQAWHGSAQPWLADLATIPARDRQ